MLQSYQAYCLLRKLKIGTRFLNLVNSVSFVTIIPIWSTLIIIIFFIISSLIRNNVIFNIFRSFWTKSIFLLLFKKINIKNKEFCDKNKKYIFIANHSSALDSIVLSEAIPGEAGIVIQEKVIKKFPLLSAFITFYGKAEISASNYSELKKSLSRLNNLIDTKMSIVIFPEGTRTRNGKISDFKKGIIFLIKHSDLDIVPLTLNGFHTYKHPDKFMFDREIDLEIIYNKPIINKNLKSMPENDILKLLKNEVEKNYYLREQNYRSY